MITDHAGNPLPVADEAQAVARLPYHLLACDLDGTIVQENRCISDRVKRALALASERGVQIALATGRSYQSTLPFAELLDIHLPLICYQGGLIQHPDTGQTLYSATLDRGSVEEAIRLSQTRGWELLLYTRDEILLAEHRDAEEHYRQMFGASVRRVRDLRSAIHAGAMKLAVIASEREIPAIAEEMSNQFAGRMEIVRSHSFIVEATPPGTSKGNALAWLAEHLAIPQRAVAAIGDQDNDASMVAWAGLGVAMGNGSPGCKRVADWISPTIDEDGSAIAIERFLL
jgi:Cof subfamily protein (haloacid dehalogenase superfamily)